MSKENWETAPKDVINKYLEKCKLFVSNDNEFKIFRKDTDYGKILEGGEHVVGEKYLSKILSIHGRDLLEKYLEKFKENDLYGGPTIRNYEVCGGICPNTIHYISTTFDIKRFLGEFQPKNIIEVGAGFGALCKTLSVVYDFDKYIIVDLPEVLELCKKYLNHFDSIKNKIEYVDSISFKNYKIKENDLFISEAALAECSLKTQLEYIDCFLSKSKYGYMTYNTLHINDSRKHYEIIHEEIKKNFDIKIETTPMNSNGIFLRRNEK